MKLKDGQGREWEFKESGSVFGNTMGFLYPIRSNPMPDLEEGDWHRIEFPVSELRVMRKGDIYQSDNVIEIRKANGTVWRRGL